MHRRIQLPIQDIVRLRWGSQLVMVCSGIREDSVAQGIVGSSVPYILRSVVGDSIVDTSNEGHEVAPQ